MFGKNTTRLVILLVALNLAAWAFPQKATGQSETPADLVEAVNSLRATHGLQPYQVDPGLMAYAQEHSEYQASIQMGTHRHKNGSLSVEDGLLENIANGQNGYVTIEMVLNEIWTDETHQKPMLGPATGEIGAGLALAGNGQVYFTLNVRPGGSVSADPSLSGQSAAPLEPTLVEVKDTQTASIAYSVREGDTLWGIAMAYGTTVAEIQRLNGITGDTGFIYVGQPLLIPVGSATETPALVSEETTAPTVPPEPTATESPTASQEPTPAPTAIIPVTNKEGPSPADGVPIQAEPAPAQAAPAANNSPVVIALVLIIGGISALVVLAAQGFRRRKY